MKQPPQILRGHCCYVSILVFGIALGAHLGVALPPDERILSFHSDITVNEDASMLVRETIKVRSAGVEIKRGIYRDFPTRYQDPLGNQYLVGFEVIEAQRDGQEEAFRVEDLSNGKRIYLGRADVFLPPGEYTYILTYITKRQLGFFADHDELYWNVTGNGWGFRIDQASATVTLPQDVPKSEIRYEGYTGEQGSRGQRFTAEITETGNVMFLTTAALLPREGLTIVVSWPKGYVISPTSSEKLNYFVEDNRQSVVALVGLVVVLGYYLIIWSRVGKDPTKGAIFPLYEPPRGMSPAAMRYLSRMGFDHKAFAASVLNMAVKRYLTISETDGLYTLNRASGGLNALAAEEREAARKLLGSNSTLELKNTNHGQISDAIAALRHALQTAMEKVYFFTNQRYLIPGLVLSAIFLIATLAAAPGPAAFAALFMAVWLLGWTVGVAFLTRQVLHLWRGALFGPVKPVTWGGAIFLSLFSLPFYAGEIMGLVFFVKAASLSALVLLLGLAALAYLFHHLLKAPTYAGRRLMDQIDGFKMFLAATEKDRLNVLNPPDKTPELFEKYLPYALALDVEQEWSEKFADVLTQATVGQRGYSPSWYSGTGWSQLGAAGFASLLGSSLSNAISSSSTAPGSRSGGGGGGSSGGGGGGGGGGGW